MTLHELPKSLENTSPQLERPMLRKLNNQHLTYTITIRKLVKMQEPCFLTPSMNMKYLN